MLDYLKKNFFSNFLLIIIIFSLDRASKLYVILKSETNLSSSLFISKFLNINLIWNDGIAFGLFSLGNESFYNFITTIILVIIAILFFITSKSEKLKKYSYIIITGGALGNLFDRIVYKSVPDFIDLHYNDFHWFIFNVADIFITIGVICLIYDEVFLESKRND
tara:strand:- start:895 stop:1386 length:492 start_codon:yes stop_codon:yes gene_type:complete